MAVKHKELIHITQDELTEIEGEKTRKCKFCGKSIWYDTTKVSFNLDGSLGSEFGGTTHRTEKNIDGVCYPICVCQNCLEKEFPDFKERNKSKIFNTFNKYVSFAFGIPESVINEKNKKSVPTLDNLIRKYGEEKGREVYEGYRMKQAYTNSFEYKKEKYGWTKEQFDEYNRSRAVTLKNLIKRHGREKGKEIWEKYKEKQSYTSTDKYLYETFGEKRANEIKLLKMIDVRCFISAYGEKEGREIYEKYLNGTKDRKTYSKFSKIFFDELKQELTNNGVDVDVFYGDDEHWRWSKSKKIYFFDFYIPKIKLVIELNGDYWHCNPKIYREDYVHELRHLVAIEIWKIDEERENTIRDEMGLNLIVVWENDIRKNRKEIISSLVTDIKKRLCTKK